MRELRPILLAEDNPNDVELALTALRDVGLQNEMTELRRSIFSTAAENSRDAPLVCPQSRYSI